MQKRKPRCIPESGKRKWQCEGTQTSEIEFLGQFCGCQNRWGFSKLIEGPGLTRPSPGSRKTPRDGLKSLWFVGLETGRARYPNQVWDRLKRASACVTACADCIWARSTKKAVIQTMQFRQIWAARWNSQRKKQKMLIWYLAHLQRVTQWNRPAMCHTVTLSRSHYSPACPSESPFQFIAIFVLTFSDHAIYLSQSDIPARHELLCIWLLLELRKRKTKVRARSRMMKTMPRSVRTNPYYRLVTSDSMCVGHGSRRMTARERYKIMKAVVLTCFMESDKDADATQERLNGFYTLKYSVTAKSVARLVEAMCKGSRALTQQLIDEWIMENQITAEVDRVMKSLRNSEKQSWLSHVKFSTKLRGYAARIRE